MQPRRLLRHENPAFTFVVGVSHKLSHSLVQVLPAEFLVTLANWARCVVPGTDLRRMKCSEGAYGFDSLACDNGGGAGFNWLWSERLPLRKSPQHWIESLPDNTECGTEGDLAKGKAKKCTRPDDFCDKRIEDFGGVWSSDSKEHWRNFNVEKEKQKCRGTDGKCQLIDLSYFGYAQGVYRCVTSIDRSDPRYAATVKNEEMSITEELRATYANQTKVLAKHDLPPMDAIGTTITAFARWQRMVSPFAGGRHGMVLATKMHGSKANLKKAYIRTGDYVSVFTCDSCA